MLGSGSEVVITVEPIRDGPKADPEKVRAAVTNSGSGLREWIVEEAAWFVTQFTKVALSVAVYRGVGQLFRSGLASESAFQRAANLWSDGPPERSYRVDSGAGWRPGRSTGYRTSYGSATGTRSGNGFDQGGRQAAPENPKYVATVGGYHLYLHNTVLDPARQHWCCPLLFKSACESCSFLEYDRGGTPHCTAVLKLRTILDGVDGGENFDEIRQWVRNS